MKFNLIALKDFLNSEEYFDYPDKNEMGKAVVNYAKKQAKRFVYDLTDEEENEDEDSRIDLNGFFVFESHSEGVCTFWEAWAINNFLEREKLATYGQFRSNSKRRGEVWFWLVKKRNGGKS